MRKSSITPEIEKLVDNEYKTAIHQSTFHQKIVNELTNLINVFSTATTIEINRGTKRNPIWRLSPSSAANYVSYVNEILSDYQNGDLLTCQPKDFSAMIFHKDLLVNHTIVNLDMRLNRTPGASLATRLVNALRYDDVRKKIVPIIYRKLELKTCVYCNANYTISDEKGEGYYDLDHWKPKSHYPFLCISFFNLQPSCPSCNKRKSDSDLAFFGLWDDIGYGELDVLRFKLDERSLVNYLVFLDRDKLEINLIEADPTNQSQQEIKTNTENKFHINSRYKEHRDFTEEIVWKCKIYNASMIKSLRASKFSALIPNPLDLQRFIIGTYADPDDIHKRPLTRLAIDVAKQLGLI